jgi:hypothetical protein
MLMRDAKMITMIDLESEYLCGSTKILLDHRKATQANKSRRTTTTTMASRHSDKRQKTVTGPFETEASLPIQTIVDAILNVDRKSFKECVRIMDRENFKLLSARLSELSQDMEDTLTKFCDIPANVIASNVFPYLENRTDWNNFSLVNKDINKAVTSHKCLEPPWPEGKLKDESIVEGISCLRSPTFAPDGKYIANGDEDGNIYIWSRTKGLVANWHGHDDDDDDEVVVNAISFSPDGNLLVTVGFFLNIKIWDLANDNRCLREWTEDHVSSVAFSPDGKCIATAGGEVQPVYLRNVSDGTTSRLIRPAHEFVHSVVFSPDGRTLALGGTAVDRSGSVELWKLDGTEDSRYSLEGHSRLVWDLAYSPDGAFLASASNDKTIRLWDVANQRCVRTLLGHTSYVYSISFTSNGNFLASGGHDRTIRLWSVASGNCTESLKMGNIVYDVEFSLDSRMLLSYVDSEMYLRVVDTEILEELMEERTDLMKLNTQQLQQALTKNQINFDTESTKVALVDHLVTDLDRSQRKEILARWKTDYL